MATKKGFHVLIEALPELLAAHPDAHVVLAGGGDLLADVPRAAAERFPGRLHLPGPVLRDTLPDLYRAADLFVLPAVHDSKGNVDGLPNVILEAMASGLPVVASAISGIPLAVEDGRHRAAGAGAQTRTTWLAALRALLARSGSWRGGWGSGGGARPRRELTWDAVAARYREGYLDALSMPSLIRYTSRTSSASRAVAREGSISFSGTDSWGRTGRTIDGPA